MSEKGEIRGGNSKDLSRNKEYFQENGIEKNVGRMGMIGKKIQT